MDLEWAHLLSGLTISLYGGRHTGATYFCSATNIISFSQTNDNVLKPDKYPNKPKIYDLQNMKHMLERDLKPSDFEQLLRDFVTVELVELVLGMRSGNQDGDDVIAPKSPTALFQFSGVSMSEQIFAPRSVMPVTDPMTSLAIVDNPVYVQSKALPKGISPGVDIFAKNAMVGEDGRNMFS